MTKKIEFTDRAKKQIKKITSENDSKKYFRISVKGGGCSGFKYNFSFVNSVNNDDVLFNTIKMGLNKGYNEYLRRINFPLSNLTEREIVQHIINHDPRAVVND